MITTVEGTMGSGMSLTAIRLCQLDIEAARIREINRRLREPEEPRPNYYREKSQAYSLYLGFRDGGSGGLTGINEIGYNGRFDQRGEQNDYHRSSC